MEINLLSNETEQALVSGILTRMLFSCLLNS